MDHLFACCDQTAALHVQLLLLPFFLRLEEGLERQLRTLWEHVHLGRDDILLGIAR